LPLTTNAAVPSPMNFRKLRLVQRRSVMFNPSGQGVRI
jgi:hypothetical protein